MDAMDFMDPKQRRRYNLSLMVGYVLVGLAILLMTLILVYVAYGYGYKNGEVIQSGLVFLSSAPNPAQVYINGKRYQNDTNTRLTLPAGTYDVDLKRNGYRDWQRTIIVEGGRVEPFTYPLLFPSSLTTTTTKEYAGTPELAMQSPNGRWLVVSQPGVPASLDIYDLNDPKKAPVPIALTAELLSPATSSQSLSLVGWSDDNTHFLLKHTFDASTEYLLVDREAPDQSANLTRTFGLPLSGADLRLRNARADQYLFYDAATQVLSQVRLSAPALQPYRTGVLSWTAFSDNLVLYATPDVSNPAKVDIDLYDGGSVYTIRQEPAGRTYLLALDEYGSDLYVAISASGEDWAYVYRNPAVQIQSKKLGVAQPVQAFHIKNPSYVSFAPDANYLVFESGADFASYDTDQHIGYSFSAPDSLDPPQTHVAWMDGARFDYVSHGQVIVCDYDGTNRQVLASASPQYPPFFTPDFKLMYAFVPSAADRTHELLTTTPLRTPADQ